MGTTVVIGGGGTTGRRVAARLAARGEAVRLASRRSPVRFDWDDRGTWAPVLRGATSAYIAYAPDLAVPGADAAVGDLAGLAARTGVRRLVLLSGRGEEGARRAEAALRAAGAEWTILRCAWFAQNFSEGHLLEPLLAGELALPVGDVPEPFVDVDDVADVAVAALTGDGHGGRVHELTGPRALTFAGAVDEIARAAGRELRFATVPMDAFTAGLEGAGTPPDVVRLMRHLFTEVLDGRNARPTDGVRRAIGREARDFGAFARDAAAAGAWRAPAGRPLPA
ncbi:hypothetical protein [Miltoncostaea marina]|uniref:hypothetical protein n=1 Tax=Miltoncostaea marina TaxID=2843215 RepID=UPI001C3D0231|nr:hypothetical protein [Miltoncostaea marina]